MWVSSQPCAVAPWGRGLSVAKSMAVLIQTPLFTDFLHVFCHSGRQVGVAVLQQKLQEIHFPDLDGKVHLDVIGTIHYSVTSWVEFVLDFSSCISAVKCNCYFTVDGLITTLNCVNWHLLCSFVNTTSCVQLGFGSNNEQYVPGIHHSLCEIKLAPHIYFKLSSLEFKAIPSSISKFHLGKEVLPTPCLS